MIGGGGMTTVAVVKAAVGGGGSTIVGGRVVDMFLRPDGVSLNTFSRLTESTKEPS
jgi:hypothetical protein